MTERILKSTISVMEAFNRVRNDQSFAHDNEVLNYNESLLIFGHVTSSIRFIEAIEKRATEKLEANIQDSDDIPF
jgi:cyclophilin family peptidyl-prolyl cis-trans isomerase